MRKSFSKMQQTEILGEQDYKCRLCHTRFSKNVRPIYDHIDGDHSNNSIKNGQAICSNCHDIKSAKENQKRSIEIKNINFVKRCPLCHKKLKGKDFRDPDTGKGFTTDHLPANQGIQCTQCKSEFKVIRKDPKAGDKKLTGKKVEAVQYCPHCDTEFDEKASSNRWLKCDNCNAVFGVWIKKYNEISSWRHG
jgi:Zn finger protein HypA/HybF involved in hydrogenase expression